MIGKKFTKIFHGLIDGSSKISANSSDISGEISESFLNKVYKKLKKERTNLKVGETYNVPVSFEHNHGSTLVELEFKIEDDGVSFPNKKDQFDKITNKVVKDLFAK